MKPPLSKHCARCGKRKPISQFGKRRDRPGQYVPYCRLCASLRQQERYWSNPAYRARCIALATVSTQKRRRRPSVRAAEGKWARDYKRKLLRDPQQREKHRTRNRDWFRANPEFNAWRGILARCFNENHVAYKHYGGRGITVCRRWRDSFEDFLADIGSRPGSEYSIHRIDNDGHYKPGNVEWATKSKQSTFRRGVRLLTFRGREMTATAVARLVGLPPTTLLYRLRVGWTLDRAIRL